MSSDSSEDENLDKLREATDPQFITNAMFDVNNTKEPQVEKPPSLRRRKDDDEQFNLFRVSPAFRNHAAKHLSSMLDELLQRKLRHCDSGPTKHKRRKNRVKLFKTSAHCLETEAPTPKAKPRPPPKDFDDDDARFKAVAITPEDICQETKHWSTRSKAPIYEYLQTKQGLILK